MPTPFAAAIFIAAFLLFQVQLILAKHLLPWFGGTPSVWTTCMLFFQVLLLAGYSYAHGLDRWLSPKLQTKVHLSALAVSLVVAAGLWAFWGTGLLAPASWAPEPDTSPQGHLLLVLLISCGLPFFLLAATSPLLQRWYTHVHPQESPYRLYALSNAGSLLGLVSYPLLVEPWIDLVFQSHLWCILYAVFVCCCVRVASPVVAIAGPDTSSSPLDSLQKVSVGRAVLWALLSALAVAMLLAVTQQLSQEVAVIPLLWVLPLGLYLLTFILCFDRPAGYRRNRVVPLLFVATFAVLVTTYQGVRLSVPYHVIFSCAFLYLFCRACHGELVRLRPTAARLTYFYLVIGAGGVVGGLLISIVAPLLLNAQWDFHLVLIAGWLVLALVFWLDRRSPFFVANRVYFGLILLMISYIALRLCVSFLPIFEDIRTQIMPVSFFGAMLVAACLTQGVRRFAWGRSALWARIAFGAILLVAEVFFLARMRSERSGVLVASRNFYGTLSVEFAPYHNGRVCPHVRLTHGAILHGLQRAERGKSHLPASYYVDGSGVALALKAHPRYVSGTPMRIGVLGMGVGSLAAYGRERDFVRFYEINPAVIALAQGPQARFTFIRESKARVEVASGDARLLLQREYAKGLPGAFDILVLDAFTSDAVPAHLLTREAFELYREHLRDRESVIAVNISNRFLDLRDLVYTQGRELDLAVTLVAHNAASDPGGSASLWAVIHRPGWGAENSPLTAARSAYKPTRRVLWTDRYSSLLRLLYW